MFNRIKKNHEEDKQLFEKLSIFIKLNPESSGGTSFIQANQDCAELIQLAEEVIDSIKTMRLILIGPAKVIPTIQEGLYFNTKEVVERIDELLKKLE